MFNVIGYPCFDSIVLPLSLTFMMSHISEPSPSPLNAFPQSQISHLDEIQLLE